MNYYVKARQELVSWLRQQLGGPGASSGDSAVETEHILIGMSPLDRYPTGVLHAREPEDLARTPSGQGDADGSSWREDDEDEDEDDAEGDDSGADRRRRRARAVRRRRYALPSSVGFSCYFEDPVRLLVSVSAARYDSQPEREDETGRFRGRAYERRILKTHYWNVLLESSVAPTDRQGPTFWGDRARIALRQRPRGNGYIVTLTLVNTQEVETVDAPRLRARERIDKALFEAQIECVVERGKLCEYPRVDPALLSEEERELELQYKDRKIYALGHGAAVDWTPEAEHGATIRSDFLPAVEVPIVKTRQDDDRALDFEHLASGARVQDLSSFVGRYRTWIESQKQEAAEPLDPAGRATADRICGRMDDAARRMDKAIELLRSDALAAEAFQVANRAMFDQMRQKDLVERGKCRAEYLWRPFQLAFLLTVLTSAALEDDLHRDVLDLIWFPTGGGKTEAYLGLIAFVILYRRLKYGDEGGGTVAIMRYTLRLLSRQQFERASVLICALELIRRDAEDRLGEEPISLGLWVGGQLSPNRNVEAEQKVAQFNSGNKAACRALVLERCPWCGSRFEGADNYSTDARFAFYCRNEACQLGGEEVEPLPCNVVDETLYGQPPSLLIATVDKFARLAWEPRAAAFFGSNRVGVRPPELIVQDELHLIAGPLGSVAGLYEAGVDTALQQLGMRVKYVASTATIQNAKEQVSRLYARDLAIFPPPGLSCEDSYFASTDEENPGRLYVGYLAPGLDQRRCLAPLAAALTLAPLALFRDQQDDEALLDAWWTTLLYHGSLQGVANSHNSFATDVRDFGRRLIQEILARDTGGEEPEADLAHAANAGGTKRFEAAMEERLRETRIGQLTGRRTPEQNAEIFDRMGRRYTASDSLDAVLATNMVSVGLDVDRLASMVVNGQPLTTGEYIQTTGRVGRSQVPGLVVTNYYRHQARSLSHYEGFRAYHMSFHRFVEPTSVTPYTYQVRSRALHAAIVLALRITSRRLRGTKAAGEFRGTHSDVRAVVERLAERCCFAADSEQIDDITQHVDVLVNEWDELARSCEERSIDLHYGSQQRERNADLLLCAFERPGDGRWRTLNSMRNVEDEGMLKLHA